MPCRKGTDPLSLCAVLGVLVYRAKVVEESKESHSLTPPIMCAVHVRFPATPALLSRPCPVAALVVSPLPRNISPILLSETLSAALRHDGAASAPLTAAILLLIASHCPDLPYTTIRNSAVPSCLGVGAWPQLFLVWMLYAYTALALRENVLKLNGSDIRYEMPLILHA